ncbi:CAP-Gly domain-containing linker protein 1 isoform X2 [Cylas formicarius]|uniref:CAP-Gly domain-containing linker protein 1 isoform X2 n=1 Tax=Cylas formicarius TaxID=197179 RepID=UPI0029583F51|nr:CAP-Gly domain-containing linker protein 1 isoform X2 [Cylas formicarius]
MSDTDDTDDLLLIPPDFFSLESEPEPPYYNIVDNLIRQVSKLQNRIETIENTSELSLIDSSLENSTNMSHKYNSMEDVYQPGSAQSTPQKPRTKCKLNSLPASPNVEHYSPRKCSMRMRSPQKGEGPNVDSKMLNEIDNFISNAKTIHRSQAARNLEESYGTKQQPIQLHKMDSRINVQEPQIVKENTWSCGDNIISKHNSNFGPRDEVGDESSDSSSESTQLTAYNKYGESEPVHVNLNAMNALSMHRKLMDQKIASEEVRLPKKRGIHTLTSDMGLLNLADIWGSENLSKSPTKLKQKLKEEKLRRQHCEQLINELQTRNLELQQKLAVAMMVDDSKNETIRQFKGALEKVTLTIEKLNEEKMSWTQEMAKLKKQSSLELETSQQKLAYYEKEASKALNLAHANQDKISSLETRCSDLQSELEVIENKLKDAQSNYDIEVEKNKQLAEIITQKEIELKESKTVLSDARTEVFESHKAVEVCQKEFSDLKNEYMKLQSDLRHEKGALIALTEQKKKLLSDLQNAKAQEKHLKESLDDAKAKLESTKLELRNYYQGQLEIIVENKRKEMQTQLDKERQMTVEEFKKKEVSIARTAANHIKEISEKCALEIKLLEEKHQEEVRLYQLQIVQLRKELEHLQTKLAHLPEKRAQIAKQLQKVMESQFNEAIKMMSSSPASFTELPNGDSILNDTLGNHLRYDPNRNRRQEKDTIDGMSDFDETPVSSRGGEPKQSESEIQKYINMLLNRHPGNPTVEPPPAKDVQARERPQWQPGVKSRKQK